MIDPAEVQSLILRPRAPARMRLQFLRFDDPGDLVRVLELAGPAVTFAAEVDGSEPTRHLGLTAAGLLRLKVGDRAIAALSRPFLEGMRRSAHRLGDDLDDCTVAPFRALDPPIDLVLIDSTRDRRAGGPITWPRGCEELEERIAAARVARWKGKDRDGYEHFGFRDGITDPVIEGSGRTVTPGNGVWDPDLGGWRAVRPGEALLGHPDERGVIAGHPAASAIERDGSYLVIRRLEQHVHRFHETCRAIGALVDPPLTGEEVEAQLVGRHPNGTPLGLDHPNDNDFRYRGPRAALRVPPSSHIRRANPRDDLEAAALMVPRHQLFRRGIPYGPRVRPDEPDGVERGLLFLALCADLGRQFEFVQRHWLQDGSRFGLGAEPDGLTGRRDEAFASSGDARGRVSVMRADGARATVSNLCPPDESDPCPQEERACPISSFVTPRGGEYVLLPSRAALAHLASLGAR